MRVFARQSKAALVDAPELFRIVSAGVKYYENFFDCEFPFSKYDQIFVPEFRISGMENVGAVALTDNFLKPIEEKTDFMKMQYTFVVLHELSHMWFGDLITMKWWTDLWLKESFADFMGVISLMESEELKNYKSPEELLVSFTFMALEADVKSTTHPI